MSHARLLLAILIVEALLGYPRRWRHPVEAVGRFISRTERAWNIGRERRRRFAGMALATLLILLAVLLGWSVERLCGGGWGVVGVVLVGTTGLAQRSLHDHVRAVASPLARRDIAGARSAVAMIVGRDMHSADEHAIATAAIESLAESFCDGVVAPAFWYLIGGLPGLFAAKAINTADSMIGHRTVALAAFGWASARADDVVNWVPARIAGALIVGAGGRGWRVMHRDARGHASPNGGWPEAAMAGALGRTLGGPVTYGGDAAPRAWLGDGPAPDARDLGRALAVYHRACLLLWLIVGALAWAR